MYLKVYLANVVMKVNHWLLTRPYNRNPMPINPIVTPLRVLITVKFPQVREELVSIIWHRFLNFRKTKSPYLTCVINPLKILFRLGSPIGSPIFLVNALKKLFFWRTTYYRHQFIYLVFPMHGVVLLCSLGSSSFFFVPLKISCVLWPTNINLFGTLTRMYHLNAQGFVKPLKSPYIWHSFTRTWRARISDKISKSSRP